MNQSVKCFLTEEKKVGMNSLKSPKTFINYLQTIDDADENLEDYNRTKKLRVLLVVDNTIAATEANIKLSPLVIECS